MMNWYGGGMGAGTGLFWLLMVVFWVALVGLIAFLVVKLLPGSAKPAVPPAAPPPPPLETPEQILDRLFATGEIDEQTYRARRTALTEMRKTS